MGLQGFRSATSVRRTTEVVREQRPDDASFVSSNAIAAAEPGEPQA
jgi:hypothetical protein